MFAETRSRSELQSLGWHVLTIRFALLYVVMPRMKVWFGDCLNSILITRCNVILKHKFNAKQQLWSLYSNPLAACYLCDVMWSNPLHRRTAGFCPLAWLQQLEWHVDDS